MIDGLTARTAGGLDGRRSEGVSGYGSSVISDLVENCFSVAVSRKKEFVDLISKDYSVAVDVRCRSQLIGVCQRLLRQGI